MKLSELVARTLQGDGVITGRDDKGLYIEYDRISFVVGSPTVKFFKSGMLIGTMPLSGSTLIGAEVHIDGMEGRFRLQMDL